MIEWKDSDRKTTVKARDESWRLHTRRRLHETLDSIFNVHFLRLGPVGGANGWGKSDSHTALNKTFAMFCNCLTRHSELDFSPLE